MKSVRNPPGPKGNFLLGNFTEYSRDPLGFLTRCAGDYGDVVSLRLPATRIFLLSDPLHIEKVLTGTNVDFAIHGGMRIPLTRRLFGRGLLTSEGAEWRRQRRLTFPLFSHSLVARYGEIMVDETNTMLSGWKHGQTRNVYKETVDVTIRIVIKALLGGSDQSPQVAELAKSLATLKDAYVMKNRWQGFVRVLPLPIRTRFKIAVDRVDNVIDGIIRERRSNRSAQNDLLSVLMAAEYDDGNPISDEQLRGELKTFLITGHEAPATLLAWALYLLARHPESESKLLAEIEEVLGGRVPDAADLKQLSYTSQVLKETLRLYPPAWFVAREAVRDCEIGDYSVPQGTQLLMSQWLMHRDSRFWEKPELFRPERWENSEKKSPKYAYFPYGGGPRFCMGSAYTEMLTVLVLAMIMRKFRFEVAPDQIIEPYATAVLLPKNGIRLILTKRTPRAT